MTARPKVKVEVLHGPHERVSDERLQSLMGKPFVEDVRISVGHRASTVHVTFTQGNHFKKRIDEVSDSASQWLESEGYAENVEVNRVWFSATDKEI